MVTDASLLVTVLFALPFEMMPGEQQGTGAERPWPPNRHVPTVDFGFAILSVAPEWEEASVQCFNFILCFYHHVRMKSFEHHEVNYVMGKNNKKTLLAHLCYNEDISNQPH